MDPDLLPTKAMTWIEKGTVANLAYDRYWAAKTGKEPHWEQVVVVEDAVAVDSDSGEQRASSWMGPMLRSKSSLRRSIAVY